MTDEIFSARLRQAREHRKLSQQQLAEAAALPPSSISHFESGSRKPSFDNLGRLATALDVTTDYLLGRVPESTGTGTSDQLHRHLSKMSKSDMKLATDFLDLLAQRNGEKPKGG